MKPCEQNSIVDNKPIRGRSVFFSMVWSFKWNFEKARSRANRKKNPPIAVNKGFSKEVWASGTSDKISGMRSNKESAMEKPAEKAQTTPMLLLNFFMNMPADNVAANATIPDSSMAGVFIWILSLGTRIFR